MGRMNCASGSHGKLALPDPKRERGIFISWTRDNGRTADLAHVLGLKAEFVYPPGGLLLRYWRSALTSMRLLRQIRNRPEPVVVMLPPLPLALVVRSVLRGRLHRVALDLHTGFFYDPKWRWAAGFTLRLFKHSIGIVTNDNLAQVCKKSGVDAIVLHDVLADYARANEPSEGFVLCPLSYANDEPIESILEAARMSPSLEWVLSGRPPEAVRRAAPRNVRFSGYVAADEYALLVRRAAVVVALTTRKDTMQRAAYEALMYCRPIVTSDFDVLRGFFGSGASYVVDDPKQIATAVSEAVEDSAERIVTAKTTLRRRMDEQEQQVEELARRLGETP